MTQVAKFELRRYVTLGQPSSVIARKKTPAGMRETELLVKPTDEAGECFRFASQTLHLEKAAEDAGAPADVGLAWFGAIEPPLGRILKAVASFIHRGRSSTDPDECIAADELDLRLHRLCFSDVAAVRQVRSGLARFRAIEPSVRRALEAGVRSVQQGRSSNDPSERAAAAELDSRLQDLCLSLMGDWFADWMRARSVFLVNFRQLLSEHPGQYVLIAKRPETDEWDIVHFAPKAKDIAKEAARRGLGRGQYFIERVVEGAEKVAELDLSRPEDT